MIAVSLLVVALVVVIWGMGRWFEDAVEGVFQNVCQLFRLPR
jgi:hypothetical protein